MTQTLKLLDIEVVLESETGMDDIGDLDFGVPADRDVHYWIDKRRAALAAFLRMLANRCEQRASPFNCWLLEPKP